MEQPLVTVITPVFNNPHLMDTIRSVMTQDYPNLQYIVIDDGSDEFDGVKIAECVRLLNSAVDVIILENGRNLGTVATLNRAVEASSGEYIFNIAADDEFCDSSVISDWVSEFERTGAMVITGLREVYDPEMKVCLRTDPSSRIRKIISKSEPLDLFHSMETSNYIVGCCTAQSRRCFELYGGFDERYRFIEDYPRYLRLSREGVRIHLFERNVVRYRSGGISAAANYGPIYETESNSIFETEILPYTDDEDGARSAYARWKHHMDLRCRFTSVYISRGFFGKAAALIAYMFQDPPMAAQFLQERILIAIRS